MPLVSNLDLLRIEPALFTEAGGSGLSLVSAVDAAASGNVVTSAGSDFITAGVSTLDVAVLDGEPVEIMAVNGTTSLDVSRRRVDGNAPALNPKSGSGLALNILTFDVLLQRYESWILGQLGISPDHAVHPVQISQIVNLGDVKGFIAIKTIAYAYARAAAQDPASVVFEATAALYATLVEEAARGTTVLIDLDGNGAAEHARRLEQPVLSRH